MKVRVVIDGSGFKGNGTYEVSFKADKTLRDLKDEIETGSSKLSIQIQNEKRIITKFNVPWGTRLRDGDIFTAYLSLSRITIDPHVDFTDNEKYSQEDDEQLAKEIIELKDKEKAKKNSEELNGCFIVATATTLGLPCGYYMCTNTSIGSRILGEFSPRIAMGVALFGAALGFGAVYIDNGQSK